MISGSSDKSIIIWNIQEQLIKSIDNAHDRQISCLCITADQCYIISGSVDKSFKIWNIEGKPLKSIDNSNDDYVISVASITADS